MSEKNLGKNALVLGLALFAMFFGAGNLIFPPAIGLSGGTSWALGFTVYFIADLGLALLSIFAMFRADGDLGKVTGSIGKVPSVVLNTAIIVCVGPLLAIPRTAATSFEMMGSMLPISWQSPLGLALFSVLFFVVVLLATLNPQKVVESIGELLTPILVVVLAALIIAGIANPSASAGPLAVDNLVQLSVLSGYETMDMMAALIFAIIAVEAVDGFGYANEKSKGRTLLLASLVSMVLLLAMYGGLAYLGATTGQLWSAEYLGGEINQASLLRNIAYSILGKVGAGFLSAVALLACLTTAIGLVSACSAYFKKLLKGKLGYRVCAVTICVISCVLCNAGLSRIISFSVPVLLLVYPVALFLTVMSFFSKELGTKNYACVLGAIVVLLLSLCDVLADYFGLMAFSFVHVLPLDGFGFGWLVPTVVAALIGFAFDRAKKQRE